MAMLLTLMAELLRENGLSATVFPSDTPEKPPMLLIKLVSGQNTYLLELHLDGEKPYWKISDQEKLLCSATSESYPKESPSTKFPAVYSYDQLSLWPLESNK